jgi:copper oxidase (laccase) domain-containing protein
MRSEVAVPISAVEFFPALNAIDFVRHAFIGRIPGIDVTTGREEALRRLDASHAAVRAELGLGGDCFATAGQVHGNHVAVIDARLGADHCFDGVDALVTNQSNVSLGIYVADCCAVFLVDPVRRVLGLVHSGRKGTELAIVPRAIQKMNEHFAARPRDLIAQLSPAIRPPHYEVDFTAEIARQLRAAGVEQMHDSGRCTACGLTRYYSYRVEKGRTGRMLALLALR